jgi:hypothetical protein
VESPAGDVAQWWRRLWHESCYSQSTGILLPLLPIHGNPTQRKDNISLFVKWFIGCFTWRDHYSRCWVQNRRRIKDEDRVGWKPARIFVVDDVSFLKVKDMTELNKKLQNLREDTSKPFGGVSLIFSGDFH